MAQKHAAHYKVTLNPQLSKTFEGCLFRGFRTQRLCDAGLFVIDSNLVYTVYRRNKGCGLWYQHWALVAEFRVQHVVIPGARHASCFCSLSYWFLNQNRVCCVLQETYLYIKEPEGIALVFTQVLISSSMLLDRSLRKCHCLKALLKGS